MRRIVGALDFQLTFLLVTTVILILALTALPVAAQDLGSDDCSEGEKIPCGSNIGACEQGIRACVDGQWGDCLNETGPVSEICTNQIDDDCDGFVDECGGFLWMIMLGIGLLLFSFGVAVANKWTD